LFCARSGLWGYELEVGCWGEERGGVAGRGELCFVVAGVTRCFLTDFISKVRFLGVKDRAVAARRTLSGNLWDFVLLQRM